MIANTSELVTICIPLTRPPYPTRVPFPPHTCEWVLERRMELIGGAVHKYYCRRICGATRYVPL